VSDTKTRPILFSAPMVRAILEGRKTQTRRVVKPQPVIVCGDGDHAFYPEIEGCFAHRDTPNGPNIYTFCPYGKPGDLLWVRESGWQSEGRFFAYDATQGIARCSDDDNGHYIQVSPEEAGSWDTSDWKYCGWKRTPSIHMPRWASRITLRITDIRVERVQSISERDASREGLETRVRDGYTEWCDGRPEGWFNYPQIAFCGLWDSINGGKPGASWAENPWCWRVSFERVEGGVK
jgi:hypothetical protein